ncbi:hypothetical protein R1flu_023898 [Riccia fluitans]|uniref:Reverse transcriptase zinc-binding domain-containing protein n=1 Tax=Riccia fluitans TaxID=41844 RepID=A0ABD1XWC3_9MARC
MSGKWPEGNYTFNWKNRWRRLWEAGGTQRVKIWIWRILRKALFTGERAEKMRVSSEPCGRCKSAVESIPHLFYDCENSRVRWNKLRELVTNAGVNIKIPQGLLNIMDEALAQKKKGILLLYILYIITTTIWRDRNQAQFNNKILSTPLRISLEQARLELEGSLSAKASATRWQQGIKALDEVNKLISATDTLITHPGQSWPDGSGIHPGNRLARDEQRDINSHIFPRLEINETNLYNPPIGCSRVTETVGDGIDASRSSATSNEQELTEVYSHERSDGTNRNQEEPNFDA